jgi:hypothetical protein
LRFEKEFVHCHKILIRLRTASVNRCLEKPMTSFWLPLVPLLVAQMGFLKSEYIRFSSMGPWMDFPWNNQR